MLVMQMHTIGPDCQGLVVGSDGLWDVLSNEDVAAFVAGRSHMSPLQVSTQLVQEAFYR